MIDNFITAGLYTLITAIVATFYFFEGRKIGVQETLIVLGEHEPDALRRVQKKLREILSVTDFN